MVRNHGQSEKYRDAENPMNLQSQFLGVDVLDGSHIDVDTANGAVTLTYTWNAKRVSSGTHTIVVTATRREENLQDVPIAITAITTKTLDDLQVDKFEDYARLVPSLSFKSGGGGGSPSGPGTSNVYFRGVASGEADGASNEILQPWPGL